MCKNIQTQIRFESSESTTFLIISNMIDVMFPND